MCEVNVDDCDPNPCANGGQCIDEVNDFICDCEQGFVGKKCQHTIDFCESDPCQNGATCTSKFRNSFKLIKVGKNLKKLMKKLN